MDAAQHELLSVLHEAREWLSRPDNEYMWSSWEDEEAALLELDALIERLQSGRPPGRAALEILFLPTGPMQEVALSSGWGDEFCALAARYDRAADRVYAPHPPAE